MGRKKIVDEFTDLPVSRQRKNQLRNPEKYRVMRNKTFKKSAKMQESNRVSSRKYGRKHREHYAEYERQKRIKKQLGEL